MIFRCISLFLSFGFAYFHLFIYILPYLTYTRRIEQRSFPPSFVSQQIRHNKWLYRAASLVIRPSHLYSIAFAFAFLSRLSYCVVAYHCHSSSLLTRLQGRVYPDFALGSKMICPQCLYDRNMINTNTTDK